MQVTGAKPRSTEAKLRVAGIYLLGSPGETEAHRQVMQRNDDSWLFPLEIRKRATAAENRAPKVEKGRSSAIARTH